MTAPPLARTAVPRLVPVALVVAAVAFATVLAQAPGLSPMRFSVYLFFAALVARTAGFAYAVAAAVLSAAAIAYWFLPPIGFRVGEAADQLRLAVFVVIACTVGRLVAARQPRAERVVDAYPLRYAQSLERSAQALDVVLGTDDRVAAVLLDDRGRVVEWSRGAARLTGFAADAVTGRPVAAVLPEAAGGGGPDRPWFLGAAVREGTAEVGLSVSPPGCPTAAVRAVVAPLWQATAAPAGPPSPADDEDDKLELGGYCVLLRG